MAVVLVVGASRGIGAAIAARYVKAGDQVAATHRGSGLPYDGVLAVECDIRSKDSVDAAFTTVESELGTPDIVVVNAAVVADGLLMRMDEEQWSIPLDTNLSGAWRVAQRASRGMVKAKAGSLVFVSSASAAMGAPGQTNYAAAKAGLTGLSRSIVRELGGRGVRANVVAPGPTETDMTSGLTDAQRETMRVAIPMGRYASADEVAEVVEWVSKSTFMAGAVVPVDGGISMGQ